MTHFSERIPVVKRRISVLPIEYRCHTRRRDVSSCDTTTASGSQWRLH